MSAVFPISTETEFRSAMARDYGHDISGLGPRQSVDHVARVMVDCIRHPRPEVHPHPSSKALAILNAVAPKLTDSLMRRYGRRRKSSVQQPE